MQDFGITYWNSLAENLVTISALLGGFSIAVTANLLVQLNLDRVMRLIMKFATVTSGSFLVTVFSQTKVLMMTTAGAPKTPSAADLAFPNLLGGISFFLGIIALCVVIALSGWTKSKGLGRFTTGVAICTLLGILMTVIEVSV